MPSRPKQPAKSVAAQAAELALAVPQVVSHRLARLALSGGGALSERDREEFGLMVHEKHSALSEAFSTMALASALANQRLALSMFQSLLTPGPWGLGAASALMTDARSATVGVLEQGLAPIHRTVTDNARRLARTKLR